MKKKLLAVVTALLGLMLLIGLVACDKETSVFRVKVLLPDGAPAANVQVQVCDAENEQACYRPVKTTDGVAEIDAASLHDGLGGAAKYKKYKVKILALPDGYTADPVEVTPAEDGSGEVTVTLKAE